MAEGGQNTGHDSALGWFIIAGIAVAIGFLFWIFFEYQIKDIYRWIRYGEMWLVSLFVSDNYEIIINNEAVNFKQTMEDIANVPAANLSAPVLSIVSQMAMGPLKMIFAVLMALMGMWALVAGPGTQYRRSFNLDGLINAQAKNFPIIAPFVKFNPSNQQPRPPGSPVPAELPPFAEALGPEEWLAYNAIQNIDGQLDQDALFLSFAKQLGARWQGPMKLPKHSQVFLAACCLKVSRKRGQADDFLGRLAMCWSLEKGLQVSKDKSLHKEAMAVLRKKELAGLTLSRCNQHAFQTTALLRALQTAREEGGVMAPAAFVWMRAHDRLLWYPLNNLGRQAFHIEALGAMSHFKAEKMTNRPIPRPKVENAVRTINEYMSSIRARPVPQLDYSQSSKRGIKKPKAGVKKPKK
jgi:intracellular multiplication protein IcmP